MEIKFIGQGYNLDKGASLAEELIRGLNSEEFSCFKCLVAFASPSGVSGLTPHILKSKKHIDTYQIIVGLDNFGTSKEALEELLLWEVKSYVYHSRSHNIFHPKIYLFEGKENSMVIVGSNNLTEFGLVKNIEGAIMVKYTQNEENKVIKEIKNYFQNLLDNTDVNLKILTQELIDDLYATEKILPNEEKRKKLHDEKYGNSTEKAGKDSLVEKRVSDFFGTTPLQSNPKDFKPKRKLRSTEKIKSVKKEKTEQKEIQSSLKKPIFHPWAFNKNNIVLIAEIGKGERWKQVNFPIEMFEEFFGAKIGDNSYHIKLRHLEQDGNLGEIENRKAVSVKSRNFRFEIGAATSDYPNKDRPIGVFIKIASDKFLYSLLMPSISQYSNVKTFLLDKYTGPSRNLSRIISDAKSLKKECSTLSFWEMSLFTNQ